VTGELTALVGARVTGEHRHPALVEQFTVLEGTLSIDLLIANTEGKTLRLGATITYLFQRGPELANLANQGLLTASSYCGLPNFCSAVSKCPGQKGIDGSDEIFERCGPKPVRFLSLQLQVPGFPIPRKTERRVHRVFLC